MLKRILARPGQSAQHLDDPDTTKSRREVIAQKKFLNRIYVEWYQKIAAALPPRSKARVELGSGAGFMEKFVPGLLTSEILLFSGVDAILSAFALPFANSSLDGILMVDVLHHLPQPRTFFKEAARCVEKGGSIIMIEPWVTSWSAFIYRNFHHEPFLPRAADWEFPSKGPLSDANSALPYIIFDRDRTQFEKEFPEWEIQRIEPFMPFRYLLSGGFSARSLMPGFTFGFWRGFEKLLIPLRNSLAMFVFIKLGKK